MLSSDHRPIRHLHNRTAKRIPTVCVVDPQSSEYLDWKSLAEKCGARLETITTAEEALRVARTGKVDLWLINTTLPGLSGEALCGMLKAQNSHTVACLVSDEYSPEAERSALLARATAFLCKAASTLWLAQWLTHWHTPRRAVQHA